MVKVHSLKDYSNFNSLNTFSMYDPYSVRELCYRTMDRKMNWYRLKPSIHNITIHLVPTKNNTYEDSFTDTIYKFGITGRTFGTTRVKDKYDLQDIFNVNMYTKRVKNL